MGHTACIEPQCLYKGALYLTFTFASQAPDVAGNLRKLSYPRLNPRVYCVGSGIDKVALDQIFFFLQAFRVFCASYNSTKCLVHICFWGTI